MYLMKATHYNARMIFGDFHIFDSNIYNVFWFFLQNNVIIILTLLKVSLSRMKQNPAQIAQNTEKPNIVAKARYGSFNKMYFLAQFASNNSNLEHHNTLCTSRFMLLPSIPVRPSACLWQTT